jgi:predicted acylesterase/phospholipase RssA
MAKATTPTQAPALDECDLVMKGGITSGIVYPPLVLKLKNRYRFRNVGGTSAGAIAAAATAAAEFGRDKRKDGKDGFDRLHDLKNALSGGTFLHDLFQPSRETRPLMDVLFDLARIVKSKRPFLILRLLPGLIWTLLRRVPVTFVLGALSGLGLSCLFAMLMGGSLRGAGVVPAVLISLFSALAACGIRLFLILTADVPRNFFGMCMGLQKDSRKAALTSWLAERLDAMAGIDNHQNKHQDDYKPLTFGDLKNKPFGDQRDDAPEKEANISLKMVTSNLSQNQPFVLPFKDDHLFLFNEEDFRKLFPTAIVKYLVKLSIKYRSTPADHPKYSKKYTDYDLPAKFHFFPEADDLPVIVATRMSLSFPLLLSAVPLYTIKPDKVVSAGSANTEPQKLKKDDLQINWFSDGGICSNFPIHFFDKLLPARPTFGVNLTSLPEKGMTRNHTKVRADFISICASQDQSKPRPVTTEAIYLPKADDPIATEWIPLNDGAAKQTPNLFKFLWAIFSTAQNYRDNSQSMLPSYRERIVQIRLSENEGGLNLAMPEGVIKNVVDKGEAAGDVLLKFKLEVHQWVRFRVLMKQMEASLEGLQKALVSHPFYMEALENPDIIARYPYPRDATWCCEARSRLTSLIDLVNRLKKQLPPELFAQEPPLPEPVLRVTPEL